MNFRREGLLVRWAYIVRVLAGDAIPHRTSLCALFWRVFVLSPAAALLGIALLPFLAAALVAYAIFAVINYGLVKLAPNETPRTEAFFQSVSGGFSIIGGFLSALKNKACPIVTIE